MNIPTKKHNKGFTLIELIVVILILSILATLILPKLVGKPGEAKVATAKSNITSIHQLLEQFRLDCDRYPTTQEGLDSLYTQPANVRGWKGPYTSKPIGPDPWGNAYIYEYPGQGGKDTFTLMSYGSDGAPGGDGDAADIIDGQF